MTIGLSTRHLDLHGRKVSGGEVYGTKGRIASDALGSAQAETVDVGVSGFVWGPLYLGVELHLGGATLAKDALLAEGLSVRGGGVFLGGGALVGVVLPRLGLVQVRAETFAGGWVFGASTDSTPVPDSCDDGCGPSLGAGTIEPRGRADVWITPWSTVGAWAGANALHGGDWSGGLTVSLHGRAGDGVPW
jgi:hypothetical protein